MTTLADQGNSPLGSKTYIMRFRFLEGIIGGHRMAIRLAIFGLGRVGLPLALSLAKHGCNVIGCDIDEQLIERLRRAEMPFLEEGGDALLKGCVNKNFYPLTSAKYAVENADIIIITLGTPVDENQNPVFNQIESVFEEIMPYLSTGQLIVLRSTVSPGTTEHLCRYLEEHTTYEVGRDIFLAFCPERIAEGVALRELEEIPQLVGALDSQSAERAEKVFRMLTPTVLKSDARSVELAKLFGNMYRYIHFAIANEFMILAESHGCDIHEVRRLVNEGYKRGGLAKPGLTGGPCLSKDGFFLTSTVPFPELIASAKKINESIPSYLLGQVKQRIPLDGKTVAILGMAFKRNIDDTRNALSSKIKKLLLTEGAVVLLHDPYTHPGDLDSILGKVDVAIFAINHDAYHNLTAGELAGKLKPGAVVCDVWNIFNTGKIVFSKEDVGPERTEANRQVVLE